MVVTEMNKESENKVMNEINLQNVYGEFLTLLQNPYSDIIVCCDMIITERDLTWYLEHNFSIIYSKPQHKDAFAVISAYVKHGYVFTPFNCKNGAENVECALFIHPNHLDKIKVCLLEKTDALLKEND